MSEALFVFAMTPVGPHTSVFINGEEIDGVRSVSTSEVRLGDLPPSYIVEMEFFDGASRVVTVSDITVDRSSR